MTEFELFQALRPFYPAREYALLPQVADGTGAGTSRHCDALALSLWPSRGLHLSGFEMKSYRGDWLRELKNPAKAEEIAKFCNYWWIVAGGPFVKAEELPPTWGLMIWDDTKTRLTKIKAAPFREVERPDLPFLAATLRKAQDVMTPSTALAEAREEGRVAGQKQGEDRAKYDLENYRKLKEQVKAFEKASGIEIGGWCNGKDIGEAVNQVLNGTVMRERERLRATAEYLLRELGTSK